MSIKSKHNPYFDFLRGVAILMVVGIHTYPGGHSLNGSVGEFVQLLLINIFNCAVPLFLAISGYFIARKKLDSLGDCTSFWKKQIPVVYIPCLIFSVPWLAMYYISNDYISGGNFQGSCQLLLVRIQRVLFYPFDNRVLSVGPIACKIQ